MKRPCSEKPVALRKLPSWKVALRVSSSAANCIPISGPGWHDVYRQEAKQWLKLCANNSRRDSTSPDARLYTRGEKAAMRALARQIEAALGKTA